MKRKISIINKLLVDHFGIPPRSKKLPNPVDLLIATILSQNTNDKNSYKAFKNLKEKYKKWEDVARLTQPSVEKLIKVAGLGKQKSSAILSNVLPFIITTCAIEFNDEIKNIVEIKRINLSFNIFFPFILVTPFLKKLLLLLYSKQKGVSILSLKDIGEEFML